MKEKSKAILDYKFISVKGNVIKFTDVDGKEKDLTLRNVIEVVIENHKSNDIKEILLCFNIISKIQNNEVSLTREEIAKLIELIAKSDLPWLNVLIKGQAIRVLESFLK